MSTLEDRLAAAAGIRKGLESWPDANHWCKGMFTGEGPNGEKQSCTYQMLINGGMPGGTTAHLLAKGEICRVAETRGHASFGGNICAVNNTITDFATLRDIVDTAAANLEKAE